jgi:hypothetical protein
LTRLYKRIRLPEIIRSGCIIRRRREAPKEYRENFFWSDRWRAHRSLEDLYGFRRPIWTGLLGWDPLVLGLREPGVLYCLVHVALIGVDERSALSLYQLAWGWCGYLLLGRGWLVQFLSSICGVDARRDSDTRIPAQVANIVVSLPKAKPIIFNFLTIFTIFFSSPLPPLFQYRAENGQREAKAGVRGGNGRRGG